MPTPSEIRSELKRIGYATIKDAAHWRYHAVRLCPVPETWGVGQSVWGDCSKGVQFCARWAGAPDPMENNWAGWGNSSTLWVALEHADHPSELRVGDVVTFGHDGDEHAAWVLEAGSDPLLWSFGHQGAPNAYRLSQDSREHQLLFSNLADDEAPKPPTPADKLRVKTGYFSWIAWRLGEGAWRKYGKANKTVRPNVRKVIPAAWWLRYAKFLKNRKLGG